MAVSSQGPCSYIPSCVCVCVCVSVCVSEREREREREREKEGGERRSLVVCHTGNEKVSFVFDRTGSFYDF